MLGLLGSEIVMCVCSCAVLLNLLPGRHSTIHECGIACGVKGCVKAVHSM